MIMCATVVGIQDGGILVTNNADGQEVIVNTRCVNFCEGDRVKIIYNGMMTMSIPPQINATRIIKLRC